MNYKELQDKLAESDQKFAEMEALVQQKIEIEMQLAHPNRMAVLKMNEQISNIRNRAIIQHDRIKKEYAMQNSPADVGDVIEAEIRISKPNSGIREIIRLMRVERIEVAAFEEPMLTYYGTYIKEDGTPYARQMNVPIYQKDITSVKSISCRK
jgi:ribosomal protein S12